MHIVKSRFLPLLALVCIAAASLPAQAVTHVWPGSAPCGATLQACINGSSNGDRIEIASNLPIDESLSVSARSLELVAANGYRPRLVENATINISSLPSSGDQIVLIDGIRLRDGYVGANYTGVGSANYTFRNMVFDVGESGTGAYVGINTVASAGTMNLTIYNNHIQCSLGTPGSSLIWLIGRAATSLNADVYNNKMSCSTQLSYGILAVIGSDAPGVSHATLNFHGNEVRAEPYAGVGTAATSIGGIGVQENSTAISPSTIDVRLHNNVLVGNGLSSSNTGIVAYVDRGDMNLLAINNTVTGWNRSLVASSYNSPGSGTQNIDGIVANNVMVSSGPAFMLQGTTTASLTNSHNLINAPSIGTTLGANSIAAPARLVSESMPRLRSDSPAIDAGDYATLASGVSSGVVPSTDADGLRRFKGTSESVDMGAYQFGDMSFEHRVSENGANISRIYSPALDGRGTVVPQVSLLDLPGAVNYFGPYALDYAFATDGRWLISDLGSPGLPLGTGFNLFVPATGDGSFRHQAPAASITDYYTQLDNAGLTGEPDLIVLATQSLFNSYVFNPHPISVAYSAPFWYVDNNDQAAMPTNASFSIYWQQPSPNAFRITASAANLELGSLRVNHPLLDSIPCARPQATRMTLGTSTRTKTATWRYSSVSDEWYLDDDGFINTMPIGTQFNVVIDPAQVALCTDRIFASDF